MENKGSHVVIDNQSGGLKAFDINSLGRVTLSDKIVEKNEEWNRACLNIATIVL